MLASTQCHSTSPRLSSIGEFPCQAHRSTNSDRGFAFTTTMSELRSGQKAQRGNATSLRKGVQSSGLPPNMSPDRSIYIHIHLKYTYNTHKCILFATNVYIYIYAGSVLVVQLGYAGMHFAGAECQWPVATLALSETMTLPTRSGAPSFAIANPPHRVMRDQQRPLKKGHTKHKAMPEATFLIQSWRMKTRKHIEGHSMKVFDISEAACELAN